MRAPALRYSLKSAILLFWALWFTIVAMTNLFDGLKALGILPGSWSLASGNYEFMRTVTAVHGTPTLLVALMFAGVIAWEGLAALLHWRAWRGSRGVPFKLDQRVQAAFVVSLSLWAAFILADEIFVSYQVEATHFRLLMAELLSLLVLTLVPDQTEPQ